ncbi:MAG: cyclic nucleotide-binding domain-containing protein [Candidatus Aegiribacteria sp.]|nr:cyclic nucleotide-binding domain-containing protein [Candidatus Aegiribacteria sp.]
MDYDDSIFTPVEFLEEKSFVDACSTHSTEEQEIIIDQGSFSNDLYIIRSGRFVVSDSMGEEFVLAALSAGDVFGEMAFFRSGIRSASVTCVAPGEILSISRETFKKLHETNPDLAIRVTCTLAGMLSDRLKHADATLSLLSDDSELRQRYEIRRLIRELKSTIHKLGNEDSEES